jgi:oligopeptide transport system substrate-binding protein
LKVVLERPTLYFLQLTAHPVYSPVHRLIDQEYPQWPYQSQKNYPCNGPFQVKINHPTQGYHLIRNPFYWDLQHISWDQIVMTRMIPLQAIQAFQRKEIDWVGNPFGSWHPSYLAGKDDSLLSFPNSLVYWAVFNAMHPLFSHKKLRQAFAFAINRAEIIAGSFLPLIPAYSPLLSPHSSDNHSLFPEHDAQKARRLFHEALEELGLSLETFPPINLVFHQKGIREYTALCLKQQFRDYLGVECTLKPLLWGEFFNKISDGDFHIALVHWNSWIDDPIYTLNSFKSSNEKINLAKWEDAAFRNFLDLSDQEVNPFQRSSYLLQAEGILSEEMPVVPIFYQPAQALVRKDLNIFYRSPCGPFNLARSFNKKKQEY